MSALFLFIIIAAFMFFMHRGHGGHGAMGGGGMGCCGGGHAHGTHDHDSAHEHEHNPDLASMKEAEYVEVTDEPVKEVGAHHEEEYVGTHSHNHNLRPHVH